MADEPGLERHRRRERRRTPAGRAVATLTCTLRAPASSTGRSTSLVVAEEAGTGLGSRCAGTRYDDPGADIGERPPTARVRIGSQSVNLWDISTSSADGEFDRSVVAGEASGRWLWIVLRPASALLLLRDDWILRDVSGLGPPPGRAAVRWSSTGLVKPYAGLRAHRPPHPLGRQRRDPDARGSWCAPVPPPGSTSWRSPTTTPPPAGPRPRLQRARPASTLVRGHGDQRPARRQGRPPAGLPARPDLPAAGRGARPGPDRPHLPAAEDAGAAAGDSASTSTPTTCARWPAGPSATGRPARRRRAGAAGRGARPDRGVHRLPQPRPARRTSTATPRRSRT